MTPLERAFLAVPVPPAPLLLAALNDLRALGDHLRVVLPDHLHLTLHFFGPVTAAQHAELHTLLLELTASQPVLPVQLQGAGLFPDAAQPTVIWTGLAESALWEAWVDKLRQALADRGWTLEPRPWVGHVTLARVKGRPPAGLRAFLAHYGHITTARWLATHLDLMNSRLTAHGPEYQVVHRYPLAGRPG